MQRSEQESVAGVSEWLISRYRLRVLPLGSDFNGAVRVPFDTSGNALITEALLNENFKEEEIAKIMGGNFFANFERKFA